MLCGAASPLAPRAEKQLPAVPLTIRGELASNRYVEVELTARHPSDAGLSEQSYSHNLRIATDRPTLSECDDLCMCRSSAADTITYSSACRASIKLGSSCHVPKPAVAGGNWASGID